MRNSWLVWGLPYRKLQPGIFATASKIPEILQFCFWSKVLPRDQIRTPCMKIPKKRKSQKHPHGHQKNRVAIVELVSIHCFIFIRPIFDKSLAWTWGFMSNLSKRSVCLSQIFLIFRRNLRWERKTFFPSRLTFFGICHFGRACSRFLNCSQRLLECSCDSLTENAPGKSKKNTQKTNFALKILENNYHLYCNAFFNPWCRILKSSCNNRQRRIESMRSFSTLFIIAPVQLH